MESSAPHRIRFGRVTYERAEAWTMPIALEPIGTDAEGRQVFADPERAGSRKYVFLSSGPHAFVGYVRPDPPRGLSLQDIVQAAFADRLPRPDALALLGILTLKHVVLVDGTRLGGARERVAPVVAQVALEPDGFVDQAARVPEWALLEALRPRWERLASCLLRVSWVRELADPEFGYVRSVTPRELLLGRTTREPVDVDQLLEIGSQDNSHPPVLVIVSAIYERDVRVAQTRRGLDERVAHGDPVSFVAQPAV